MKDAFDSLDELKLSPETAEKLAKAKPRLEAKAKRQAKLFAMLPIERFQKLAAEAGESLLVVTLELDRLVLENYGRANIVNLSNNRLQRLGVSRYSKYRALKILEREGLVSVIRKGKESPLVTVLWR